MAAIAVLRTSSSDDVPVSQNEPPGFLAEKQPELANSTAKTKVNNTVVATGCASFSHRPETSANASAGPFDASETGNGPHGDDDGVRVRLEFAMNFQVHLGTFVNGVYHPKGMVNGRRLFCRSLGGGGTPHLFMYYMPETDSWCVGMYPGDSVVYAVCGPAGDRALAQPWQVWDGASWVESPADSATLMYKSDQQTARWEDQGGHHDKCAGYKKAHQDIRQKLFNYAKRGGLHPLLEKGGILQDHVIVVATDKAYKSDPVLKKEPCHKMAWDIKICHSTEVNKYKATDTSPLGVANAYKEWLWAYNDTKARCAKERSWRYEPAVFTFQNHKSPEAEALINLLAIAVARVEKEDANVIKEQILQSVYESLP